MVEKLAWDLFLKMKIEQISALMVQSFIQFVFGVCQVEDYRNILKLSCRSLAFTSYWTFFKIKKRSATSLSFLIFCLTFEDKYFSFYILLIDGISLSGCLYFARYVIYEICTSIIFWPCCDVMYFEVNFVFLIKPFFLHDQKVMTKT